MKSCREYVRGTYPCWRPSGGMADHPQETILSLHTFFIYIGFIVTCITKLQCPVVANGVPALAIF